MHTYKLFSQLFRVRMADWLMCAVLLTLLVWLMAPQQLPVSVYKLSLVALAAVAGYWIDRSLFPYARPDSYLACAQFAALPNTGIAQPEPINVVASDCPECSVQTGPNADFTYLLGQAMLRRAIIVAATMLAVGLGA